MKHANHSIAADLTSSGAPAPQRTVISPSLTPVETIMTRKVTTVTADTSVEALVELMLSEGLSRIPVVDEAGRPIGMVAKTDLVEDQFEHTEDADPEQPKVQGKRGVRYQLDGLSAVRLSTVGELMTDSAVTLTAGATIKDAARAMSLQNLHGLPVVDSAGKLVGVVSTLDIVAWVSREC